MEDLRFYDMDFNRLHIEHDKINAEWDLKLNEFGTFTTDLSATSEVCAMLRDNVYIIVMQGSKQGILSGFIINDNICTIYAKTLNWLCKKRTVKAFEKKTDTIVNFATAFVTEAFEAEIKEGIFEILQGPGDSKEITLSNEKESCLYDLLVSALEQGNYGFKIQYDIFTQKWYFGIIGKEEKTLIISDALKTATDTEYTFDLQDYFSEGVYYDAGEEPKAHTVIADELKGMKRWVTSLDKNTESEAMAELKEKKITENIDMTARGLKYGVDYKLGDIFRVQCNFKNRFKMTVKKQVIGVKITENDNYIKEEVTFKEVNI